MDLPPHDVDPVTLHEVFDDADGALAYRAELADLPDAEAPETLAVRVPLLRVLAAVADDPDAELAEAERLGWLAVALAGGPSDDAAAAQADAPEVPLRAVQPLLRLAQVLQFRHRFSEADLLFGLALETARYHGDHAASIEHARKLEYLALRYWGTCRYDQALEVHAGQARPFLGEALAMFERALEQRVEADASPMEIRCTRLAVRAAHDRLAELGG